MKFNREARGKSAIAERLKKKVSDNADLPDNADASTIIYSALAVKPKRSIEERISNAHKLLRTALTLDPYEVEDVTKAQVDAALRELVDINGILGHYIEANKALGDSLPIRKKNSILVLSKAYQMRSHSREIIGNYYEPTAPWHKALGNLAKTDTKKLVELEAIGQRNVTYLEESANDALKYTQLQVSTSMQIFASLVNTNTAPVVEAPKAPTAEWLIKKGIKNFESSSFGNGLEKFKQVQGMGPESVKMLFDKLYEKRTSQSLSDRVLWDSNLKEIVSTFTQEQKIAWRALKKVVAPTPAEEPAVVAAVETISAEPVSTPENALDRAVTVAVADIAIDDNGPWSIASRKGKKLQQEDSQPPSAASAVSETIEHTDKAVVPVIAPAIKFAETEYPRLEKTPLPVENKHPVAKTKARKEESKISVIPVEEKQPDSKVEANTVPNIEPAVPGEKVSAVSSHPMVQQPKHEELLQDPEQVRSFLRGLIGKDTITPKERGQSLGLHHSSNPDIRFLVDAYRLREKNMLTKAEIALFDRRIFGAENPILLSDAHRQPASDELELLRGLAISSPKPDKVDLRKGFVDKYFNKPVVGPSTQAVLDGRVGKANDGRYYSISK